MERVVKQRWVGDKAKGDNRYEKDQTKSCYRSATRDIGAQARAGNCSSVAYCICKQIRNQRDQQDNLDSGVDEAIRPCIIKL